MTGRHLSILFLETEIAHMTGRRSSLLVLKTDMAQMTGRHLSLLVLEVGMAHISPEPPSHGHPYQVPPQRRSG